MKIAFTLFQVGVCLGTVCGGNIHLYDMTGGNDVPASLAEDFTEQLKQKGRI